MISFLLKKDIENIVNSGDDIYLWVCVSVIGACVCVSVYTCIHRQKPEENIQGPVLMLPTSFPGDRVSHWTWN